MPESSKIKDFLNQLIQDQPEIASLLNQGILANQTICNRDDIFVRPTSEGDMITITGIITAISRKYGEPIASIYDESKALYGFGLYSEGLPRIVSAIPSELLDENDGLWEKQISQDAKSGKFDQLIKKAHEEFEDGEAIEI